LYNSRYTICTIISTILAKFVSQSYNLTTSCNRHSLREISFLGRNAQSIPGERNPGVIRTELIHFIQVVCASLPPVASPFILDTQMPAVCGPRWSRWHHNVTCKKSSRFVLKSREIDRSILLMGQVAPIRIRCGAPTVTSRVWSSTM